MENKVNEITGLRNHFTYVFEESWKVIVGCLILFFFNDASADILQAIGNSNWLEVLIGSAGILAVMAVIFLFYVNRWRKTYISVKDGMFSIERKLISHYRKEIALVNISNINMEQNLFEMLVGTYKLKLDTNSASTADKTDVKIVLKADAAYALKNAIMEMMKEESMSSGTVPEGTGVMPEIDVMQDISEESYDIIYDNKYIIRNCIAKTSLLVLLIIVGLFVGLGIQIAEIINGGGNVWSALGMFMATVFINASLLRSLVGSWLDDFRFRVKRHGDKVYISSGLLKKNKYAVPVNMINSVRIYTYLLGRLMGLYNVQIISVGGEKEESQGKSILLAGKMSDLREKLAVILPEYEFPEMKEVKRMPFKVLWLRLFKGAVFFVLMAIIEYILFSIFGESMISADFADAAFLAGIAVIAGFVLYCIFAAVTFLQRGLYFGENDVLIKEGCFGKRIMTIPYKKIQYIKYSQGLLNRMLGVFKGRIHILATEAFKANSIGIYDEDTMEKLNDKLRETY